MKTKKLIKDLKKIKRKLKKAVSNSSMYMCHMNIISCEDLDTVLLDKEVLKLLKDYHRIKFQYHSAVNGFVYKRVGKESTVEFSEARRHRLAHVKTAIKYYG